MWKYLIENILKGCVSSCFNHWNLQFSKIQPIHGLAESCPPPRHRRLHRHPRHVWFWGQQAQSIGAALHQSVLGDHAAFLQHSHLQECSRVLQGGRNSVGCQHWLHWQCALYWSHFFIAHGLVKHAWCGMLASGLLRDLCAKGQSPAQRQQETLWAETLWCGENICHSSLCRYYKKY